MFSRRKTYVLLTITERTAKKTIKIRKGTNSKKYTGSISKSK
jgi:hypothetical protein